MAFITTSYSIHVPTSAQNINLRRNEDVFWHFQEDNISIGGGSVEELRFSRLYGFWRTASGGAGIGFEPFRKKDFES